MRWNPPETVPMDGTEVLIKTPDGVVSAWFCYEPPTNDVLDNGLYDWICYDDFFQIDGYDAIILGWLPLYKQETPVTYRVSPEW